MIKLGCNTSDTRHGLGYVYHNIRRLWGVGATTGSAEGTRRFEQRTRSVSYTHLDVYKRQDLMNGIKVMDDYYNDSNNKLSVYNNGACYKYVRYIYNDGGWTKVSVYRPC